MQPINEERLNRLYNYIGEYQEQYGRMPSFRELVHDLGYVGVSSVQADVKRLRDRGLLSYRKKYTSVEFQGKKKIGAFHGAKILGTVRCGQPSAAYEDIEATVVLPDEIFGKKEHFLLHAKGPSMIKRGIFDGDLLVVTKTNNANIGDTVVALIGDDATTKILEKQKDGRLYLKAANDDRKYDVYPSTDFTIMGIVENVIHPIPKIDVS